MGLSRENLLKKNLPVEYLTEEAYEEDLKAIKSMKGKNGTFLNIGGRL